MGTRPLHPAGIDDELLISICLSNLSSLSQRPLLVSKSGNKGKVFVILPVSDYQLSDILCT